MLSKFRLSAILWLSGFCVQVSAHWTWNHMKHKPKKGGNQSKTYTDSILKESGCLISTFCDVKHTNLSIAGLARCWLAVVWLEKNEKRWVFASSGVEHWVYYKTLEETWCLPSPQGLGVPQMLWTLCVLHPNSLQLMFGQIAWNRSLERMKLCRIIGCAVFAFWPGMYSFTVVMMFNIALQQVRAVRASEIFPSVISGNIKSGAEYSFEA